MQLTNKSTAFVFATFGVFFMESVAKPIMTYSFPITKKRGEVIIAAFSSADMTVAKTFYYKHHLVRERTFVQLFFTSNVQVWKPRYR